MCHVAGTQCAGLHRNKGLVVKSLGMANWSPKEALAISVGGNAAVPLPARVTCVRVNMPARVTCGLVWPGVTYGCQVWSGALCLPALRVLLCWQALRALPAEGLGSLERQVRGSSGDVKDVVTRSYNTKELEAWQALLASKVHAERTQLGTGKGHCWYDQTSNIDVVKVAMVLLYVERES